MKRSIPSKHLTNRRGTHVLGLMLLCILLLSVCTNGTAADGWPMWRYDAGRTAASPNELPTALHLQWQRDYAPRTMVWDDALNRDSMPYDRSFEPIIANQTLFVGFNDSDKVMAFDLLSGEERWRFYVDGPVRLPPVAFQSNSPGQPWRVAFVSDDGYLYCVDADTGACIWKFRGGPSDRKLLGNQRLISTWPARGGAVVKDGHLYFAASIWPMMGTFLYALDAESGTVVWKNDYTGAQWLLQPHTNPAFAGVAPQGALAVSEDKLLVPGGRSQPACFDLETGEFLYYHLDSKTGGSFISAAHGLFFNHARTYAVLGGSAPKKINNLYALADGSLVKHAFGSIPVMAEDSIYTGGKEITAFSPGITPEAQWEIDVDASGDMIQAGERLYVAGANGITCIDIASQRIVWHKHIEGDVVRLLAGDGCLVAVTLEGRIMVFGEHDPAAPRKIKVPKASPVVTKTALKRARTILKDSAVQNGYAVLYGLGKEPLLSALVAESDLRLVAFDVDGDTVEEQRRQFDAAGSYGDAIAIHQGSALTTALPPYLASLTVVNDLDGAGFEASPRYLDRLFHTMRPYGGKAWLPLQGDQRDTFMDVIQASGLHGLTAKAVDSGLVLAREGALPGAGQWTHQYGNAANTVKSDDTLVKMPLGVLWFGGSSNEDVLPRHGHGPSEQIVGGRLFIEGMESISARDVYTGQVLWKTELGDLKTFDIYYDATYPSQAHIPGANARGTNFVATLDKVYVLQGAQCHVLDSRTGAILKTFTLPVNQDAPAAELGYIGVYEDMLVLGSGFVAYSETMTPEEQMPPGTRAKYRLFYDYDKSASKYLFALDRHTGNVLWNIEARHGFIHNGVAIANNMLFCLDKVPPYVENVLKRRGHTAPDTDRLLAVDLITGVEQWARHEDIFGSWLGYSAEHNVLLQATRPSGDTVRGEDGRRMIAYRGRTGKVLWDIEREYYNPPILHGDRIITHSTMYNLFTGEQIMRTHPITGEEVPWIYQRTKGCGYHIASENLVTFRSSSAAYFDLEAEGGTGHFGGFKSGCTANLVAADGVLNAPDYTRTCVCSYQNQTSLAMIHMPEVEVWTTYPETTIASDIEKIGFNFGASGDRRAENGTLWVEYPPIAGASPPIDITVYPTTLAVVPQGADWRYYDGGDALPANWAQPSFEDAAWESGPAELGYGDGDEATVLSYGEDEKNKHITTYFRRKVTLDRVAEYKELALSMLVDDGGILYVNGTEALRIGMPAGPVTHETPASGSETVKKAVLPAALLKDGTNTLAAEIHQDNPGSSDMSFDLEMNLEPNGLRWINHHASHMRGEGPAWIGASCAEGITGVTVALSKDTAQSRPCTVRLYFAEPEELEAGQRLFSVLLQGKEVLADVDIIQEAGGARRTLVQEFHDISVAGSLHVELVPSPASPLQDPILSGLEIEVAGARE